MDDGTIVGGHASRRLGGAACVLASAALLASLLMQHFALPVSDPMSSSAASVAGEGTAASGR